MKPIAEGGYKKLKRLDLSGNQIENIAYLGNNSLSCLDTLYLNENKLSDIEVLGNDNFKNLKDLQIYEMQFARLEFRLMQFLPEWKNLILN